MRKNISLITLFTLVLSNSYIYNNQLHAQVPAPLFGEQHTLTNSISNPESVFAIDLNTDGFADVFSVFAYDNKIAWFANDGTGNFGEQQIISTNANGAQAVYTTDLDKDGDVDVLSASNEGNKITWYKNDGAGNFGEQQISTNTNNIQVVYATDLDNDGDVDVLSASKGVNNIVWYKNDGTNNFSEQQIISIDAYDIQYIYTADLDKDGDTDVLTASGSYNDIAWYKNDGTNNFGEQQIISTNANGNIHAVYITDLDKDGDIDVLFSSDFYNIVIAWCKNDGAGNFGAQQTINPNANGSQAVYATDLDNDGDTDVLIASSGDNKIAWYANDGAGNFGEQQIISTNAVGAQSVYATDLDNDGDIDVLSASDKDNKIATYTNNGNATFGSEQIVIQPTLAYPSLISIADLDNDGFVDIIAAGRYAKIAWFKNNNNGISDSLFVQNNIISDRINNGTPIYAVDIDNDNDLDILYLNDYPNAGVEPYYEVVWLENDGNAQFNTTHTTSIYNYLGTTDAYLAISDLNNDGSVDIVVNSYYSKLTLLLNNTAGNFSIAQTIDVDDSYNFYSFFSIADIDNDSYNDIIYTGRIPNTLYCLKNNRDATFNTHPHVLLNGAGVGAICISDVNNDTYLDIVYTKYTSTNNLYWVANNGNDTFSDPQLIATNVIINAIGGISQKIIISDFNKDGYNDVLVIFQPSIFSASTNIGKIAWYANKGNGTFAAEEIVATNLSFLSFTTTADFDNDGDIDLATASFFDSKIACYENLLSYLPIPNHADIAIIVYPNPSHNNFKVTLFVNNLPDRVLIKVVDVTGHIVQQNICTTNQQISIYRNELPNGLYFVQVQDVNNNQVLGVTKVIFE